jgi:hypothetical protein
MGLIPRVPPEYGILVSPHITNKGKIMNSISLGAKNALHFVVHLLNHPLVKENIKKIASTATCVFGLMELVDLYQIARGQEISTESCSTLPKWLQTTNKVIIVCAKTSLILSGGVSRPGVFIISSLVGCVFSTTQLNRVFGPNTIFAVNPWHPRHVVSIAAVILALPSVAQSTYEGIHWAYKKIRQYPDVSAVKRDVDRLLSDNDIRLMTLFNSATSRPILHIGNQLLSRWLKARVI